MAEAPFHGSGLAFPFQADATGRLLMRSGADKIEESIGLILGTRRGERPMRPEFGCAAYELVFSAPASPRTVSAVARAVEEALARWEPRVDVVAVAAVPSTTAGVLLVEVQYVVRATNDRRNLVYPFYSIPPEPDMTAQTGQEVRP